MSIATQFHNCRNLIFNNTAPPAEIETQITEVYTLFVGHVAFSKSSDDVICVGFKDLSFYLSIKDEPVVFISDNLFEDFEAFAMYCVDYPKALTIATAFLVDYENANSQA
jgi:hypothetical protein